MLAIYLMSFQELLVNLLVSYLVLVAPTEYRFLKTVSVCCRNGSTRLTGAAASGYIRNLLLIDPSVLVRRVRVENPGREAILANV